VLLLEHYLQMLAYPITQRHNQINQLTPTHLFNHNLDRNYTRMLSAKQFFPTDKLSIGVLTGNKFLHLHLHLHKVNHNLYQEQWRPCLQQTPLSQKQVVASLKSPPEVSQYWEVLPQHRYLWLTSHYLWLTAPSLQPYAHFRGSLLMKRATPLRHLNQQDYHDDKQ